MMASSLASARASSRVATTEAAAVRISVSADALMQRLRLPGVRAGQQHDTLVGVLPEARVAGEDADRLEAVRRVRVRHRRTPARIAGMSAISPGGGDPPRRGRLHHGPQRLVDLAAGQRGQRPGDQVGTLPVGQQLVHVTGAEDEQLQVRHPCRLMTPVWLTPWNAAG